MKGSSATGRALGYPCGRKAGCTQFIRALVKQKSPPAKVRKRIEATASAEAVLGFSHACESWIGPNAKQVFLGVTNPMQRCMGQQGPALGPETHQQVCTTHTLVERDPNQPWQSGRVGRHLWQWHEGDMKNGCNVKPDSPQEHHSPRQTEPSLDMLFFCNFSRLLPSAMHPPQQLMLCSVSSFPGFVQALATATGSSGSLPGTGNCQASWSW